MLIGTSAFMLILALAPSENDLKSEKHFGWHFTYISRLNSVSQTKLISTSKSIATCAKQSSIGKQNRNVLYLIYCLMLLKTSQELLQYLQ
jgi:hypothetical protein